MTSFTFEELQRVTDIYAQYVKVRPVRLFLKKLSYNTYAQTWNRKYKRRIEIDPALLILSRSAQIALIVHELIHLRRGCLNHSAIWKKHAYLWASAFQMRHVRSDESVKVHIQFGCAGTDSYTVCDECKANPTWERVPTDLLVS